MSDIKAHTVPEGSIALWWLGQGGFLVKTPSGKIIVLDPYLSNACKKDGEAMGLDCDRMHPVPISPEDMVGIDLYVLTHSHGDHLDPETLQAYRNAGGKGPYLAPAETIEKLKSLGVPEEELNMTWPNNEFNLGDCTFRATFAIPFAGDDLTHVGYLVSIDNGPTAYFTGDTDYHELLGTAVKPHSPDILLTVINGGFNNMAARESAVLAAQLDPKVVIPFHYDMFRANTAFPTMLRTELTIRGLQDRFVELQMGRPYSYP